jgi:hypothetical protein
VVQGYTESATSKLQDFSVGEWVSAVQRYAGDYGYDAVQLSVAHPSGRKPGVDASVIPCEEIELTRRKTAARMTASGQCSA